MLRGQFSVSFVFRVALGFLLMISIAYATFALEDTMKKESQKQTLISVAEYSAGQLMMIMQYLQPGQSANLTFRLPMSRDYYSGQYSVQLEDIGGVGYIRVQSSKWPDMVARQPLFLNTTKLDMDTTSVYPPGLCIQASRNDTHYIMSIHC